MKGFAFMLGLGVIVSLFTAVLATQAILFSLRGTRLIRSRAALGASEQRFNLRRDYMGASKWFFSASGVILLIGAFAIAGNGLNFGIDFEGGTRITAPLAKSASVDEVRSALAGAGLTDAEVQTINNPDLGKNLVQISTRGSGPDEIADGAERDRDAASASPTSPPRSRSARRFGQSVARSALIAIIASLTVISVYIALRFEWKFAVPVLIALMHDILITGGVYALTGREVTTSTVAALLTILGFSLYDTIIVFDRVRENIPRMPSAAFSQIVNRSMSEVVVRSLATSFCTLLPVLCLYFFGGDTLKDFAFALIVGIASGTYSSIFIAAPVLDALEAARAGLRGARAPDHGAARLRAGLRDRRPGRPRRRRAAPSAAAAASPTPQDPSQGVSRAEFDDMVANLGIEEAGRREPRRRGRAAATAPPAAAAPARAARPRRPRPRAAPAAGSGAGAGNGGRRATGPKPKKPRNRKHGRPR